MPPQGNRFNQKTLFSHHVIEQNNELDHKRLSCWSECTYYYHKITKEIFIFEKINIQPPCGVLRQRRKEIFSENEKKKNEK